MLDAPIQTQLKAYLEKLQNPIELIASLDDSAKAAEIRSLLNDIAALSDKVSVSENGTATLRPSFGVARVGERVVVYLPRTTSVKLKLEGGAAAWSAVAFDLETKRVANLPVAAADVDGEIRVAQHPFEHDALLVISPVK